MASQPSHMQRAEYWRASDTARFYCSLSSVCVMEPWKRGWHLCTLQHQWSSSLQAVKRRHENEPRGPVCGLWVYGKAILQGNCVLRIYFGYLPWQGQLEGELITQ